MSVAGLVQTAIAVAASAASLYLAKKVQKRADEAALEMEGPLTQVSQGSYIPLLVGRRRLGCLFAWTGTRDIIKQRDSDIGEGKGGTIGGGLGTAFEGKHPQVYERGFLPVCVGPAAQIFQMFYGGSGTENTSGTPVTPANFPNDQIQSVFDEFRLEFRLFDPYQIFWGFLKQDFNSFWLRSSTEMNLNSRWPGICYVVMRPRLGRSPQWNIVEVDIKTPIVDTGSVNLVASPAEVASVTYTDGSKGLNGAHILAQLLFGSYPHGLGLDPALFDIPSLETLGSTLESEGVMSSVVAEKGETFQALIAQLMQDLGVMISWDVLTGKYIFKLVRPAGASIPTIPEELQMNAPPELIYRHESFVADKVMFRFLDIDRRFRPTVVALDADGQVQTDVYPTSQVADIKSSIDLTSARTIAERRSQEVFGSDSEYRLELNRKALALYPGRVFILEGFRPKLRCIGIQYDPLTGKVLVRAVEDTYGDVEASGYVPGADPTEAAPTTVAAQKDDIFGLYEVPLFLLSQGAAPRVQVPRIRNHDQIASADIWISDDNVTYNLLGTSISIQTGGSLDTGLDADTDMIVEAGPDVFLFGPPDDYLIQDLSAKQDLWRAGEQVVLINEEILFVREIVAKGGGVYTLTGVVRARMGTQRGTHLANDDVFIVDMPDIFNKSHAILYSGNQIWVKSVPRTLSDVFDIASVTPETRTLYLWGHRPLPPVNFKVAGNVNAFSTGQNVEFRWNYRSRGGGPVAYGNSGSGAGMQNSGVPVGDSPAEGIFRLRFYDLVGPTLVRSVDVIPTKNGQLFYLYTNANLISDMGAEEDFRVDITEVANGFESSPVVSITVEAI